MCKYLYSSIDSLCLGILIGTLTMELGGTIRISCEKTGYHTEMEFKLKVVFLGVVFGLLAITDNNSDQTIIDI